MKKQFSFVLTAALATFCFHAHSEDSPHLAASQFRQIFQDNLDWSVNDQRWIFTHLVPAPESQFSKALQEKTLSGAFNAAATQTLSDLARDSNPAAGAIVDSDSVLTNNPVTIVIIPGVFGEFIPIHAFEEYFSDPVPSPARNDFENLAKSVTDTSYSLKTGSIEAPLSHLIRVGSIRSKDGREISRVIGFHNEKMSLESLGKMEIRAETFTRRLEKYLQLTGPQRLLFVGYSRGAVIGLEMLARAQEKNAKWLRDVVGMVSLGGVVWGSSLADVSDPSFVQNVLRPRPEVDAVTKEAASLTEQLFERLKLHRQNLREVGQADKALNIYSANLTERFKFAEFLAGNSLATQNLAKPKMQNTDVKGIVPLTLSLDPRGSIKLLESLWSQFSWKVLNVASYSADIKKYHLFLDSIVDATEELRSVRRTEWWKNNTLPKNFIYYTVSAAMANPVASTYDQQAFNQNVGYSGSSFDDVYLLQSRVDYEAQTKQALNDSQISAIGSAFLPGVIARLNPANANLQTKFLGVMGTHHWGLALNVVNVMKDGRKNSFPRQELLKSLAAQASHDDLSMMQLNKQQ